MVDDDPSLVKMISFLLKDEGYDVISAGSGQEALQLLQQQWVDMVILDIMLPRNMDGSEGVQAAAARKFGERLAAIGLAVDFQDERLTSWQALEQMGPRRGRDRRSGELDSAAARLILQEYLDAGPRPRFPQEAE